MDLENKVMVLEVHGSREVELKLLTLSEGVEKFRGWSNYEVAVEVVEGQAFSAAVFASAFQRSLTNTYKKQDARVR